MMSTKKNIISIVMAFCIMLVGSLQLTMISHAESMLKVKVNDIDVRFYSYVNDNDEKTTVPAKDLFEAMQISYKYATKTKTLTAKRGDVTLVIIMSTETAKVNGKSSKIPYVTDNDKIPYTPLWFTCKAFGASIAYAPGNHQIILITDKHASPYQPLAIEYAAIKMIDMKAARATIQYNQKKITSFDGWYLQFDTPQNRVYLKGITEMDNGLAYVDFSKSKIYAAYKIKRDYYVALYDNHNVKVDGHRKSDSASYTFDVNGFDLKENSAEKETWGSYSCSAVFSWKPTSYATIYEISLNRNGNNTYPPQSAWQYPYNVGVGDPVYDSYIKTLKGALPDKQVLYIGDYNRASAIMASSGRYSGEIEKDSNGNITYSIYGYGFNYDTTEVIGYGSHYLKPGQVKECAAIAHKWMEDVTKGWTITVRPIS